MKQVIQHLNTGKTRLLDAPVPALGRGTVLIRTRRSLISAGTERMLVGFGKASLIQKARQQPERVKDVLNKVKAEGLLTTIGAVRSKLDQPIPLGYCNVGEVIALGAGVTDLSIGDRVISNGPHADIVRVPRTLCALIPESVDDDSAAFTVVASIGLQGIRLANPTLGEAVVVTGAGLVGLLTVQLLRAAGCRVLAIDFDEGKLALARGFGAETCNPGKGEDPVAAGMAFSRGRGVDAVIITASTTSSDPVTQAAQMSRKRGRIVLVGVTGLELNRADFYDKELSFQVSCSYGPGRYDPAYEEQGQDYPLGYVRWTEGRNFEAVLDMFAYGALDAATLVTQRYPFEEAERAYADLVGDKSGLGLLLEYESPLEQRLVRSITLDTPPAADTRAPMVAVFGAGNYASRILIPAFKEAGATLQTLVSSGGLSASLTGSKAGFAEASSEGDAVMARSDVTVVAIATRHDSHAALAVQGLEHGKHIFVEKPLGLTAEDVDRVEAAYHAAQGPAGGPQLMVGFNRRFAPQVVKMKQLLDTVREPKSFAMLMNAGAIPPQHWTQDVAVGGGRIIGEACHYVDLMRFLAGSPIVSITGRRMGDAPGVAITEDKASVTIGFADGSFGTILYLANGAASFPKERIEAFAAGRVLQLDNFRKLTGYGWSGFSKMNLWRQDKGQKLAVKAFLEGVASGRPAIPVEEIFEVMRATVDVAVQLRAQ